MTDRSVETRFSSLRQPEQKRRQAKKCHKGHVMEEGDPNVRIRNDGRRVCRECESLRRKASYERTKVIKAGVTLPFSLDHLYYDMEYYENTSTDILGKFYGFQKYVLEQAKASPTGEISTPSGRLKSSIAISMLEHEMPILYEHIMSRIGKE